MQRSNAVLKLPVRFQETARLDLHRMGTQRPDSARIKVEPEIEEWKRYGDCSWSAELHGRGQSVLGHRPELRIAETRKARRGVVRVGWLQKRHTGLQVSEGRKPALATSLLRPKWPPVKVD